MDYEALRRSPVGGIVPVSGYDFHLQRDYQHYAFVPADLPPEIPLDVATYKCIETAAMALGRLDAAASRLPNPNLLARPTIRREAVSSSALEGTYATLREVFVADYVEESHRTAEVREVLNYVDAAERGLDLLAQRPISTNAMNELQRLLVRGTPSDGASTGRIREHQVYIGERRRGFEQSRYVPPPPGEILRRGVDDWERWIHEDDAIPLLVRVAVSHYQFESLHPYGDGNGRLGRLLITLQLIEAGKLAYPVLNVSPWLKDREQDYKDHLLNVSRTGDFNEWVQFFALCVEAQANGALARIDELMEIRVEMLEALRLKRARGIVLEIVEDLIGYPVITPTQAAQLHGVTYPPAANAINRLVDLGYLREVTGKAYGRIYVSERIMAAVERD